MSRPHISSAALSPAAVPLIHLNKAPSQSQATVNSTDTHAISSEDLPTQGQTLHRSRSNTSLEIFTDVVFALLAALFFVYGLYVVHFDGKAVADHRTATDRLINATKIQGPTIFPILFAAVLGRALKAIMLWRLERGERLGLLDLLAGSTTVVNTILTQLSLRILSAAGLVLILAWAISPLGGQASLRVMTVAQQNSTHAAPMRYMSTNHSFNAYTDADMGPLATLMNGMFNAALLGPERIKESPTDLWNNVKVPHLGSLVTDKIQVANHSWIAVPNENVT
ncbi:hypothetical protein PRZ48_014797 [Zasmidium cellare]|uniref:RDD domain-containing protein n=1 Tax=Zasmidium cellare TaxID=395010 RepID=A0ABR0DZA9_ZASCE|nr:hypothetical protein PRZ48_014797 [Zasmidium cellare]